VSKRDRSHLPNPWRSLCQETLQVNICTVLPVEGTTYRIYFRQLSCGLSFWLDWEQQVRLLFDRRMLRKSTFHDVQTPWFEKTLVRNVYASSSGKLPNDARGFGGVVAVRMVVKHFVDAAGGVPQACGGPDRSTSRPTARGASKRAIGDTVRARALVADDEVAAIRIFWNEKDRQEAPSEATRGTSPPITCRRSLQITDHGQVETNGGKQQKRQQNGDSSTCPRLACMSLSGRRLRYYRCAHGSVR